jgi:hypothetical protein
MRGIAFMALAGLIAIFAVASPKPASALPAAAALNYSHASGDLIQVKKWYKKRYRYYRGPRYRYGYRPYRNRYYGRPYGYYRPYYRPYYYRRPGVNIWLGW